MNILEGIQRIEDETSRYQVSQAEKEERIAQIKELVEQKKAFVLKKSKYLLAKIKEVATVTDDEGQEIDRKVDDMTNDEVREHLNESKVWSKMLSEIDDKRPRKYLSVMLN